MSAPISLDDRDKLRGGIHVARAWFVYMDLPSGESRTHTGIGTIETLGHEWKGVSDPIGGTLAGVSVVEEPKMGIAANVQLSLSGVNPEFYKEAFDLSEDIEAKRSELSFGVVDQETGHFIIAVRRYIRGFLSSPKHLRPEKQMRMVAINIENINFRANQPFSGKWNDPTQQKRYPGDLGLQYVGYSGSETIR